jgi:hypothetical protein
VSYFPHVNDFRVIDCIRIPLDLAAAHELRENMSIRLQWQKQCLERAPKEKRARQEGLIKRTLADLRNVDGVIRELAGVEQ